MGNGAAFALCVGLEFSVADVFHFLIFGYGDSGDRQVVVLERMVLFEYDDGVARLNKRRDCPSHNIVFFRKRIFSDEEYVGVFGDAVELREVRKGDLLFAEPLFHGVVRIEHSEVFDVQVGDGRKNRDGFFVAENQGLSVVEFEEKLSVGSFFDAGEFCFDPVVGVPARLHPVFLLTRRAFLALKDQLPFQGQLRVVAGGVEDADFSR